MSSKLHSGRSGLVIVIARDKTAQTPPQKTLDGAQRVIQELQASLKALEGSDRVIQDLTNKNLDLEEV